MVTGIRGPQRSATAVRALLCTAPSSLDILERRPEGRLRKCRRIAPPLTSPETALRPSLLMALRSSAISRPTAVYFKEKSNVTVASVATGDPLSSVGE